MKTGVTGGGIAAVDPTRTYANKILARGEVDLVAVQ